MVGPLSPRGAPTMTTPPAEPSPPQDDGAPNSSGDERHYYEKPAWKRIYAFILGPMLVAAAGVGLFVGVRLLTGEDESPSELVSTLRTGGEHRRWQAAFSLTRYLQPSVQAGTDANLKVEDNAAYQQKLAKVRVFLPELLDIFQNPKDETTPRYLALVLGYLRDKRATEALVVAANRPDPELAVNSLVSLAVLEDESAAPGVVRASLTDNHEVRSVSAYVLGVLGTPGAKTRLSALVTDAHPSVRWNAAFGLARAGDAAGEDVIAEILDRGALYRTAGLDGHKQREMFLNAVRSAGMLRSPKLVERLEKIAESDEDLRARNAAMVALKKVN